MLFLRELCRFTHISVSRSFWPLDKGDLEVQSQIMAVH